MPLLRSSPPVGEWIAMKISLLGSCSALFGHGAAKKIQRPKEEFQIWQDMRGHSL
jgi:hypothetical protein